MFKLYDFYVEYGRSGEIHGLFIADEDAVKRSIGKQVYLGEVLGKHSEVSFDLEEEMFIEYFESYPDPIYSNEQAVCLFGIGTISGTNPFNYLSDEESKEEEE